ncbi:MAG: Tad domain-containing protein [Gemmatimonadota bacterium]
MKPRASNRSPIRAVANDRGAVLALVVLMLIAFLGLAALAIDLGLLYTARGEAQRAADGAAHAGAGWLMHNPGATDEEIEAEAVRVGQENLVRGEWGDIDPDQDIDVLRDERKVRVRVNRTHERSNPVRTLFAGVIGFGGVGVAASAAAQIWPGDGSECIMPFAIPDHWFVNDGGTLRDAAIGDVYDASRGDVYVPASDPDQVAVPSDPHYTGYGLARVGQQITLTSADPSESPQPGWFYTIRLPGTQGGNDLRYAIRDCWEPAGVYQLEDEVIKEPGNTVGPVRQGFGDIFNDPNEQDITWDDQMQCPVRSGGDTCVGSESRRVRPLVMFDPTNWEDIANGAKPVPITAFAGVFLESWDGNNSITVRWMRYQTIKPAQNWEDCADCLLQTLRIVE